MKNFTRRHFAKWFYYLLLVCVGPIGLKAQDDKELAPVTRTYAITNVNVLQGPGRRIDLGTVVIKDGLIVSVGKGVAIPSDAVVIKADSMFVYAGFIDGLSRVGVVKPKEENKEKVKDPGNPPPERAGINPQNDVRNFLNPSDNTVDELRNLGFTTAQVVPYGNFLPGQGAIILLGGKSADDMVILGKSALYAEFTGAGNVYPATVLGIMAKWRDLYRQASLSKSYSASYASNRSGLARPQEDRILEAFYPVIDQKEPVLFKTEKILEVQRALTLKSDLGFPLILADVKEGWPMINKLKTSSAKVFLSLDLPEEKKDAKKDSTKTDKKDDKAKKDSIAKASKPKTSADLEKAALEKRKKEAIANYVGQAGNFQKAGIVFGFSTISVKSKDIRGNIIKMIGAGLSEDGALSALTVGPAQLLGLSDRLGTIDNGKIANLVVTDKSYFNEKSKVRYVFVEGVLHTMEIKDPKKSDDVKASIGGTWSYTTQTTQGTGTGKLMIKDDKGVYSGTITSNFVPGVESTLTTISLDGNNLTFSYSVEIGGEKLAVDVTATVDGNSFEGTIMAGPYGPFDVKANKDPKN